MLLVLFFFMFCGAGDQTHALVQARQVSYYWDTPLSWLMLLVLVLKLTVLRWQSSVMPPPFPVVMLCPILWKFSSGYRTAAIWLYRLCAVKNQVVHSCSMRWFDKSLPKPFYIITTGFFSFSFINKYFEYLLSARCCSTCWWFGSEQDRQSLCPW
jgi:hypothetical protein